MTGEIRIHRKDHTKNFTRLGNTTIEDSRLSWKALGMLTFLLHLHPTFQLNLEWLAEQKRCGRDGTRAGLSELEQLGYLLITRVQGAKGHFVSTTWEVFEDPITQSASSGLPSSEKPKTVAPKKVGPERDKPTLTKTVLEQELSEIKITTTKGGREGLRFPKNLSATELESISRALVEIDASDAQALLDELAMAIRNGNIKTNNVRWFGGILKIYRRGTFKPSRGRSTEQNHRSNAPEGAKTRRPPVASAVAKQSLSAMKARVSGAGSVGGDRVDPALTALQ